MFVILIFFLSCELFKLSERKNNFQLKEFS